MNPTDQMFSYGISVQLDTGDFAEAFVSSFNAFVERLGNAHYFKGVHTWSVIIFGDEVSFDVVSFLWHRQLLNLDTVTPTVGSL